MPANIISLAILAFLVACSFVQLELVSSQAAELPADYAESLGGKVDYWHAEKMPLRVLIVEDQRVPNYRPNFKEYLLGACKTWSDASKGKISFKFVNAEPCDIKVSWTNDLKKILQEGELGESHWETDQSGLYRATIKLLTVGPDGRRPISNSEAKLMCLHELGHCLGLVKHSPYLGDIMNACIDFNYHTPLDQLNLSQRDKNTILRLYTEGDALVEKLSADSSDPKVKVMRLCFRAENLLREENFDAAYLLLERALKIDPDCGPVNISMANCCFQQGMDYYSAEKYDLALSRLERFVAIATKLKVDLPELKQARESITRCQKKLESQNPKKS